MNRSSISVRIRELRSGAGGRAQSVNFGYFPPVGGYKARQEKVIGRIYDTERAQRALESSAVEKQSASIVTLWGIEGVTYGVEARSAKAGRQFKGIKAAVQKSGQAGIGRGHMLVQYLYRR